MNLEKKYETMLPLLLKYIYLELLGGRKVIGSEERLLSSGFI